MSEYVVRNVERAGFAIYPVTLLKNAAKNEYMISEVLIHIPSTNNFTLVDVESPLNMGTFA